VYEKVKAALSALGPDRATIQPLRCISCLQRRHLAGNQALRSGFTFVPHLPLTDAVPQAP